MTVDRKSHALAVAFLADYGDHLIPEGETRKSCENGLAEVIQKSIEDWLRETMIPF